MTVGRDRIDRVIDVFVAVPICSLVAARRATPIVVGALRRAVPTGLSMIEGAGRRGGLDVARAASCDQQPLDVVDDPPEPSRSSPTPSAAGPSADLPIADYDHLAARQILDRLDSLDPAELESIAVYERHYRHRRTVLSRLQQLGA